MSKLAKRRKVAEVREEDSYYIRQTWQAVPMSLDYPKVTGNQWSREVM